MEVESVWDYPRPPRVERVAEPVRVELGGAVVAQTTQALRVLETSHPPVIYVPPQDVAPGALRPAHKAPTVCEFKGVAHYFDVTGGKTTERAAAWSYPEPVEGYELLRDHAAFYPSRMDACWLGDERAEPQEGDFYGGWITSRVRGPFKGGPGTWGW